MLEFLTRWTPLAQFLGPLIAGVAAVFAARSAGAARDAARLSRRNQELANSTLARENRPILVIDTAWRGSESRDEMRVQLTNSDEHNEARRVRVLTAHDNSSPRFLIGRPDLPPGESVGIPVPLGLSPKSNLKDGRSRRVTILTIEFQDQQCLSWWRQYGKVYEYVDSKAASKDKKYTYSWEELSYPRQAGREEIGTGWRHRLRLGWQVFRGRMRAIN